MVREVPRREGRLVAMIFYFSTRLRRDRCSTPEVVRLCRRFILQKERTTFALLVPVKGRSRRVEDAIDLRRASLMRPRTDHRQFGSEVCSTILSRQSSRSSQSRWCKLALADSKRKLCVEAHLNGKARLPTNSGRACQNAKASHAISVMKQKGRMSHKAEYSAEPERSGRGQEKAGVCVDAICAQERA